MKPERSIFGQHGPAGFPNMSAIREKLIDNGDMTCVAFWESDFDQYAKSVLNSVRTNGKCTLNQGNLLAMECMNAAGRRQKALPAKPAVEHR